jgi:thioredoxin/glutathione reductase (selenoprotein)
MQEYDYDLIVIGGGSGGMSCAKQAASLGAKVVLFDFVKPSTQGTTWGIGGTCVNVGCVPKKIMHYAALQGQNLHDASTLGWAINAHKHNWDTLVETVMSQVQMLNFRYRVALKSKGVHYINALAEFGEDSHTIVYREKNNEVKRLTARYVTIAVGGRPHIPADIPGALDYALTSDDIFSLDHAPGKTLCVGGSYIALECAGLISELGYDVTVAARSIALRGFDRQCADKITSVMTDLGTTILTQTRIQSITKGSGDRLTVSMKDASGRERVETFDTVFFATGRNPDTRGLNLAHVGVRCDPTTGKIPVTNETTNVSNIFAIGDVCEGKQELTPVAVKAGELLARRLFGPEDSSPQMNYHLVPRW